MPSVYPIDLNTTIEGSDGKNLVSKSGICINNSNIFNLNASSDVRIILLSLNAKNVFITLGRKKDKRPNDS